VLGANAAAFAGHARAGSFGNSAFHDRKGTWGRDKSGRNGSDVIDWITHTARLPTRVLAWGQETDFYGSQLLIYNYQPP
jgi:hypothetical protein